MSGHPSAAAPAPQIPARNSGTVFTDGVFDLFHANHLALLQTAATYGARLVVGVASDDFAESYKRRPVIAQGERLQIIRALCCVDAAFILTAPLDAGHMADIVQRHGITKVVYGGNATPDFYSGAEAAGIMVRLPYHDGVSTSGLIDRIRNLPPPEGG